MLRLALAVVSAGFLLAAPGFAQDPDGGRPPQGQCFEGLGCPWEHAFEPRAIRRMNCQELSHVRNAIFRGHGYCFANAKVLAEQVGDGQASEDYRRSCRFHSAAEVPLNRWERENVRAITEAEAAKRCPR